VALPAFAAACRAAAPLLLTDRRAAHFVVCVRVCLCSAPPGPQQQTRRRGMQRPGGTDRLTDGRPAVT